jgi:hemerythrin-like domain-containing protein
MTTPPPDEAPSAVLRAEHRVIVRVLDVLRHLVARSERSESFEIDSLKRCVTFFRLFADACHHAKEEDLLFPVLEERGIPRDGGPIGVMLHEHAVARQLTRQMAEALAAFDRGDVEAERTFCGTAREYIALLTDHIQKEDHCLFAMGDQAMTEDDQASLCKKFCDVGCRAFEGRRREELEHIADELEAQYG